MYPTFNSGGGDTRLQQLAKTDRNPIEETEYQNLLKNNQANDPIAQAAAANKTATDARFATNKTDISAFNDKYSAAAPNIINNTSNKYQLGTLLNTATGLGSRVNSLQTNSDSQGAGGFANSRQVDAAVSGKYLPRYNQAISNFNLGSANANAEEQLLFKPLDIEGQQLTDRLTRESVGYDHVQQQELDGLIAKMQTNQALSIAEMNRATDLARIESDYKTASEKNAAGNTQVVEVGGRKKLINSTTGAVIQDLGSSSAGGTGTGSATDYYKTNTGNNVSIPTNFNSSGGVYDSKGNLTAYGKQYYAVK